MSNRNITKNWWVMLGASIELAVSVPLVALVVIELAVPVPLVALVVIELAVLVPLVAPVVI